MPAPLFKTKTIVVTAGETTSFELPAPPYGVLNRLFVRQTDGALDGFTFSLYTSEEPSGDSVDDFSEVESDDISVGAFEVLPPQVVNASSAEVSLFEKNYGYIVNEYLLPNAMLRSALYAKLTVAGSGEKTFDIGYLIMPPASDSF